MRIEMNTNLLPIVKPDTYGSELQYYVKDDCWDLVKEHMKDLVKQYVEDALEETDFCNANVIMGKFGSPREYNFETDWFDFEIDIADEVINTIKEKMDDDFFTWAAENYHSYDGFISFAPQGKYNILDALDKPLNTWRYQKEYAISMWIMYQLKDKETMQNDFDDDIWERCREDDLVEKYWEDDEE